MYNEKFSQDLFRHTNHQSIFLLAHQHRHLGCNVCDSAQARVERFTRNGASPQLMNQRILSASLIIKVCIASVPVLARVRACTSRCAYLY